MRAWVLTSVGSPPVLADVAAPAPAPDEVVVHVAASSVNPHDVDDDLVRRRRRGRDIRQHGRRSHRGEDPRARCPPPTQP